MKFSKLGYFSRTHGTKGQLVLKAENLFDQEAANAIFIEHNGSKAPYFISELKTAGGDLVLGLEGIETPEKAKTLLNRPVFIDESLLTPNEIDHEWSGYELIDETKGSLGLVTETGSNGLQVLLHLRYHNRDVILPLVNEFIEEVDETKKQIRYRAPEGLIDIYLEEN